MKNLIKLGLVSAVSLGLIHSVQAQTQGWLKREHFAGKTRDQVESGTAGAPTYTAFIKSFQTTDFSDNYSQRISGYFTPATTGNYNFFVASDDDSDLFLSTNADPANKQKIASEPTWNGARSWTALTRRATPPENRSDSTFAPAGIPLVGGTKYYIEGVHHEGGGGDNFGATFAPVGSDPTDGDETLLTGSVISIDGAPVVSVAVPPKDIRVLVGDVAGFSALGTTPGAQYQWFKGSTAITDATNATYSTAATVAGDNNTKFHVVITDPEFAGQSATSPEVTLLVSSPTFSVGFLKDELFRGAVRTDVEDGTRTVPDVVNYVSKFDIADRGEDNFANRTSGYFTPSVTGAYVFFIASDDDSDFFISTNDDPANKTLVASEPSWNGARSWVATARRGSPPENRSDSTSGFENGINLTANTRYYIEMVHHEGGGGDNNGATFKLFSEPDPADGDPSRFTGSVIGTFAPSLGHFSFSQQPQNTTTNVGKTATFTAAVDTDAGAVAYQWSSNGTNITGATSASFTTGILGTNDNGKTFTLTVIPLGGSPTNSATATLTVLNDPIAPTVVSAGALKNGTSVGVQFDKPVNASANVATHYSLAGNTVTAAAIQADPTRVVLTVQTAITASSALTVTGVENLTGSGGANGTVQVGIIQLVSEDIGDSSVPDPAMPGSAVAFGPTDLVVRAGGTDIYNSQDGFRFTYEKATNDFDIEVQVVSMVSINNWTAGALMVRESLSADSRNWHIKETPRNQTALDGTGTGANGIETNRRDTTAGSTGGWTGSVGDHSNPNYPNAWIRLQRTNTTLVSYRSDDGVNWTTMAVEDATTTTDGALPAEVFIGIATTSHNNGADPQFVTTVVYKNYRHHSETTPAPTLNVSKQPNGKLRFTWTGTGVHLESRGAINTGIWTDVAGGGTSGVEVDATGAAQFFRLSNVP